MAEAAIKHEVSEPTICAWRKHFGQMGAADGKRLKPPGSENGRLKKLLAERDSDIEVLKEITAKKWLACRPDANKSRSLASKACQSGRPAGSSAWPAPG